MPEPWILVVLAVAITFALGYFLSGRRQRELTVAFADEREERLAKRLAGTAGCSPAQALPAVRREISYAPSAADDILFKRALYHYRQEQPEKVCSIYRDRAVG